MVDDLNFFNKTIQEVHYNPFLYVEKSKYFSEVEKLKNSLKDSVGVKEFIISLHQLSSLIEDSHFSPQIMQSVIKDELQKSSFSHIN